jgi:hypothetical protein
MGISNFWAWIPGSKGSPGDRRNQKSHAPRISPRVTKLEDRTVPAGYMAIGSGFGSIPLVAIRCDITNAILGQPPNPAGQPPPPRSDGTTDVTSQIFTAYNPAFRGGVAVASGNFDGDPTTPDQLVTAAGPTGGPHVIIWDMVQAPSGLITVLRKRAEFMAYDPRFGGGLNIACGDLDGDGRAELITAPQGNGGPHVRIWKLDISSGIMVLATEFMAFEPTFTGGVNISSGQGYRAPFQIRQVLNAQLPTAPTFGSTFAVVPYAPGTTTPGAALGIPLVSGSFFLGTGSNTPDPANPPLNLPYFTVGGGTYQFGGANLLNSLGNIAYTPNVIDPLGMHNVPPEQPLVMASWGAMDPNRPAFAIPDVTYGPFVQVSPGTNGGPVIVTRLQAPTDQPNARNQLVLAPGVGGGPIVKVYDFVNGPTGFRQNAQIQFNAFADNPALANSRTGLKVAIGNVIDNPMPIGNTIMPNVTGAPLGAAGVTFPISTNYYRQGTAQIVVSQASGGNLARVFADYNRLNAAGRPSQRTSITQLDMRPVLLRTDSVFDPNQPLNNFQSIVDFSDLPNAIDPQFRGPIFSAISHLPMTFTLNADLQTFTVSGDRGANIFAAGNSPPGQTNRGPLVRIFDRLGPNNAFTLSDGRNPDGRPVANGSPIFSGGPTPYLMPVDQFSAFSGNGGLFGVGGVSFGLGSLPSAGIVSIDLAPVQVGRDSNPVLI